jgi:hypothetical protein
MRTPSERIARGPCKRLASTRVSKYVACKDGEQTWGLAYLTSIRRPISLVIERLRIPDSF